MGRDIKILERREARWRQIEVLVHESRTGKSEAKRKAARRKFRALLQAHRRDAKQ
jgi:hypothetical protein